MKVLLTGPCGALGRWALRALVERGHTVRALDVPTRRNQRTMATLKRKSSASIEVLWGSVTDADVVAQAVTGCDAVIHNAAILWPVTEEKPQWAAQVNVDGTQNLLNAMQAMEPKPLMVFASSVSLFGADKQRAGPVTAHDPIVTSDHYTRQKAACEQALADSDVPWTILRIGVALDPAVRQGSPSALSMLFSLSYHKHPRAQQSAFVVTLTDASKPC